MRALDEFSNDDAIYVAAPAPAARAVVAAEPDDGTPPEPGVRYLLEVGLAPRVDQGLVRLAARPNAIAR